MNRNYKVIWNASLNCFMAVAEYAKSRGKSSSGAVSSSSSASAAVSTGARLLRVSAICAGLAASGLSMQATAANEYEGDIGGNVFTGLYGDLNVKGGESTLANLTNNNIGVVGTDTGFTNTLTIKLAKDLTGLTSANFGAAPPANGNAAISGVTISGAGINNDGKQITELASAGNVKLLTNAKNAVNVTDLNNAIDANKTHFYSVNSTDATAGNYNNDGATGVDAMAAGIGATATANRAVAMGTDASAMGPESTALGSAAQAFAGSATAVGFGARADQYGATAMGVNSRAQGEYSTAVGQTAKATGANSVALGKGSEATDDSSTALGSAAQAFAGSATAVGFGARADQYGATAMGVNSRAQGEYSTAVGQTAKATGANSVALGKGSEATDDSSTALGSAAQAFASSATAVGFGARADQYGATAMGVNSRAQGEYSTAVGQTAKATGANSVALGKGSEATDDSSTALGSAAQAFAGSATAVGFGARADQYGATAMGVNSRAQGEYSTAVGQTAKATGASSVAIGDGSEATKDSNIALGNRAQATGNQSIAQGSNAKALGSQSIAQGTYAKATGNFSSAQGYFSEATQSGSIAQGRSAKAFGVNSIAMGTGSKAFGTSSIAIGTGNVVSGDNSGAFGDPNSVSGTGSYAIGNNNTIDNDNTFVLGNDVVTSQDNSVVLGNGSSDRAFTIETGAGQAVGVVSVGSDGGERQVINVAAGALNAASTDAVNGSQLFTTNSNVTENRVISQGNMAALGGSYDSVNGSYTAPVYNVIVNTATGATSAVDTVAGAVNALNTAVQTPLTFAGDNGSPVTRKLGQTLKVKGGRTVASNSATTNISVTADGTDTLSVKLAEDIDLGTNGSVRMGRNGLLSVNTTVSDTGVSIVRQIGFTPLSRSSATLNSNSLTFASGRFGSLTGAGAATLSSNGLNILNGPSVTKSGIDAGNRRITRVSNGVDPTDAVNLSQLTGSAAAARTEVVAGTNVADVEKSTGLNGQDIYTVNANGSKTSAGSLALEVTSTTDANNLTDYAVDLSQGTKDSLGKADSAMQNVITQIDGVTVKTLDKDDNTANFITGDNIALTADSSGIKVALKNQIDLSSAGSLKIGDASLTNSDGRGFSVNGSKIVDVADGNVGEFSKQAINGSQLFETNQVIDQGLKFRGDNGLTITRKLGQRLDITGGAIGNLTTGNIAVSNDGSNGLIVELAENVDLGATGSIETGATTVNNAGISVLGGTQGNGNPVRLTEDGLFNGGNTIKGVADGRVDETSQQAINGSQLNTTNDLIADLTNGVTGIVREDSGNGALSVGSTADATGDNSIAMGKNAIASGKSSISIGTGNEVSGNNSGAIGDPTVITGNNSYSLGNDNNIAGNKSFTIGNDNNISGNKSTTLGNDNIISGNRSFALGNNNTIAGNRSFALGNNITIGTGVNGAVGIGNNTDVTASTVGSFTPTGSTVVGTSTGSNVVSIGSAGNERRLTNVAAGGADTDAVNVSQLKAVNNKVSEGFNISAQGGTADNVQLGETVDFTNTDSNLVVTNTDNKINYDLADDITVESVTIGNGTNDTKLTTDVRGLSVNQSKIVDVADGNVGEFSKQAINGSQLFNNAQSVANNFGGGSVVSADGTVSAPTYNVRNTAGTTQSTVAEAIDALNQGFKLQSNSADTTTIQPSETVDIGTVTGETNILVEKNGNIIDFSLNREIDVDSVTVGPNVLNAAGLTAGNTFISSDGLTFLGGSTVSVTSTGINAGGQKITNVQDGKVGPNSKQAINGSQLFETNQIMGKGFNITTNSNVTTKDNVKLSETVDFTNTDGNLVVSNTVDNGVNYDLADDITVNQVTIGDGTNDTVLTTDARGLSVNQSKIVDILDGNVNAGSQQAINGRQLFNNAQSVANNFGGNSSVNANGTVSAPTYTVNSASKNNVGDAITALDQGFTLQSNGNGAAAVKAGDVVDIGIAAGENNLQVTKTGNNITYNLKKNLDLGATGSVKLGSVLLNTDVRGLSVNQSKIVDIADGDVTSTSQQAINGRQLFQTNQDVIAAQAAADQGFNIKGGSSTVDNVELGQTVNFTNTDGNLVTTNSDNGINYDLADDITVNQVTIGDGTNDTVLTTDARGLSVNQSKIVDILDGDITSTSQQAINGRQLNRTNTNVAGNMAALGGGATYNATTNVYTAPTYTLNNGADVFNNVGDALGNLDGRTTTNTNNIGNNTTAINNLTNGTTGIVRQNPTGTGNITVGGTTGGTNVNFSGTAGDRVLSGVADGSVATGSKDAINGGQLYAQGAGVAGIIGGTTVYNPSTGNFTNANIGDTGKSSIHEAIKSVNTAAAAKTTVTAGDNIVVDSVPNGDGSTNYRVSTSKNLNVDSVKADDGAGNITTVTAVGTSVTNGDYTTKYSATGSSQTDLTGNANNITALGQTIATGANITTATSAGTDVTDGKNRSIHGANGFSATDAEGKNGTVVDQTGVSFRDSAGAAAGPNMTAAGIKGVVDGRELDDAVNFGQLSRMERRLGNSVNELGYRIGEVEDDANAGISAAMAMSSLPQSNIAGRSMVGGGIATYNGESAVAVGVSRVSDNGRWVMKVSGTADTQGNAGGSIGAGFHF
ncbi:autotransporter adhesin [Psychrobacter sp. PL19]|uniref:YadA-like family protein n=1 Tax=Psychrobacter sp. PL19 TaxID=2760711 RepID=UPI001AE7CE84